MTDYFDNTFHISEDGPEICLDEQDCDLEYVNDAPFQHYDDLEEAWDEYYLEDESRRARGTPVNMAGVPTLKGGRPSLSGTDKKLPEELFEKLFKEYYEEKDGIVKIYGEEALTPLIHAFLLAQAENGETLRGYAVPEDLFIPFFEELGFEEFRWINESSPKPFLYVVSEVEASKDKVRKALENSYRLYYRLT